MSIGKYFLYNLLIVSCLFSPGMSCAADIQPLSEFTPTDRILILAPHPDDEAIGTAGVIQKALRAGAALKVVLFTNGDHNEWAFIVYEKRLTLRKKDFRRETGADSFPGVS